MTPLDRFLGLIVSVHAGPARVYDALRAMVVLAMLGTAIAAFMVLERRGRDAHGQLPLAERATAFVGLLAGTWTPLALVVATNDAWSGSLLVTGIATIGAFVSAWSAWSAAHRLLQKRVRWTRPPLGGVAFVAGILALAAVAHALGAFDRTELATELPAQPPWARSPHPVRFELGRFTGMGFFSLWRGHFGPTLRLLLRSAVACAATFAAYATLWSITRARERSADRSTTPSAPSGT